MENRDVDVKRLSLIDVSFENDCLINSPSSSSPFAQPTPIRPRLPDSKADEQGFDLKGGSDSNLVCSRGKTVSFMDQDPKSLEKEGTTKTKKCNLRTSLAWDNEFFTSAGVLDSDELSSMIEDSEKMENRSLHRILEETQRSIDSTSTLESDSLTIASDALTMASLENELFGDVRASIQRSSRAGTKSANGKAVPVPPIHQSSKKTDQTSNGKLKPKPAPKKLTTVLAKSGRPTSQAVAHARTVQLESLPSKPTKAGNLSPVPSFTKRDSIGAHCLKVETHNAEIANSRRASSTKTQSGVPRTILPRPSSSRYSSSSYASDKMDFMTSSVDSSISGSSTSTEKSPMISINKTDEAKPRKLSSVRSGPKTPARNVQAPIPKRVLPTTKLPTSNLSSASSMSDFSASSTSTSTPKQKSTIPRASGPQKVAKQGSAVSHVPNSSKRSNDQNKTQASAQSYLTTATTATVPNLMKPSGLRMPSPKIGFFDGVKSGRSTNSNSPKLGKPQSTRVEHTKLPMSNLAPKTQEPSSLSFTEKDSVASRSAKQSPSISPKTHTNISSSNVEEVKSTMCNANGQETGLDGIEVDDGIKIEVLNGRMPLTAVDSLCNRDDSLGFAAPRVEKRIEFPSPDEGSLDEKSQ